MHTVGTCCTLPFVASPVERLCSTDARVSLTLAANCARLVSGSVSGEENASNHRLRFQRAISALANTHAELMMAMVAS